RTSTVGNCALGFCWYDDNLGAWYGYFDEQQPVTITIPVVSVVSANFDGSGSVKTVFKLSCPGGVECAKGASGFKVRAYNGKVYFAWASANIYSYSVDASSLIGGSKVGSASVAVSGSSIGLFDFWADKDGVEYVYVKDNRERVFDDDGDSQLSGCGVGSGVYSSKKGLIAPWPRNRNYDQYGCAGSFWGAPVIAREGGKSYYVWGEVTDWLGTANSYLIKVAVRGGFTYGSSASEMQAHHDALVSGLLTGSPVAAVGSGYVVGRPGFAQVSCTGGQEELSQKVASKMLVDTQFQDSKGERKATTKLLPNEERCFGDDLNEDFFVRVRDCKVGVCTSDLFDRVLCDKQSDCVYAGKCYSDVKLVASTFFGSDLAGVWGSNWKSEVSADVHGDGKVEVCDPGQWQNPAGAVAGMVTDSTTAASIGGVTVNMVGTPPNQGIAYSAITAADGTYVVSSVDAFTYDVTASKSGYVDVVKANQPVLPFQTNVVDFQLLLAAGNVVGTVRNVSGEPVGGAAVRVLGTAFSGVTSPAGTYSISSVPSGTYDVVASKASDGYDDATALSIGVTSGSTTADFTLIRALGSCTNDCTKVGSNICDVSLW
ncbi:carboxypeptidase regulatory-like domain-containing protein, partial [Candidatus Woesearchaeota archaeon]|nr:carboxypeptidase regulatory-like domain-containing protein [Candidatus Woesearchaeota archaeon]